MTPETRAFEYALGLFSVLIGLAIADIAISFHRLIRRRASVVWDPLALLAALYVLWMALGLWFSMWRIRDIEETRHYFFYVSLVAHLFVLFLSAAASLPDEVADSCDLRAYYAGNRRYFWSLIVLYQLLFAGHGIYFYTHDLHPDLTHIALGFVVPLLIPIVLLATRSRLIHYAGLAALFVATGADRASLVLN
jgi:hypothetical protein